MRLAATSSRPPDDGSVGRESSHRSSGYNGPPDIFDDGELNYSTNRKAAS